MSIFAKENNIKVFEPNMLLEKVISTVSNINDIEEKLSRDATEYLVPENYKKAEDESFNKIEEQLQDLITSYNDMDDQMIEFVKNNPITFVNISDEEFTNYRLSSDIDNRVIPFGRYITTAMNLFKSTDMNDIKSKEELQQKINVIDNEFKTIAKVPLPDNVLFIHHLYEKYSLNYDTFRLAGESLKNISDDIDLFNNPAPLLSGDYWVQLEILNFLSTFKAAMYSGYKSMILNYNDCVINILRRDY